MILVLLILYILTKASSVQALSWHSSVIESGGFHAYIDERDLSVVVYPEIKVYGDSGVKVCRFELIADDQSGNKRSTEIKVPDFVSVDPVQGMEDIGRLNLNASLLFKQRRNQRDLRSSDIRLASGIYQLQLSAYDCGDPPKRTDSIPMTIIIIPTDKIVWSQVEYSFAIDPDAISPGALIGKVTAYARPIFLAPSDLQPLGDSTSMCGYHVNQSSESNQFDIDGHGHIRLRRPISSPSAIMEGVDTNFYSIQITGFDCSMPNPQRSSVNATIWLRRQCVDGWEGLQSELTYPMLADPQLIAPSAQFILCDHRHDAGSYSASNSITSKCQPSEAFLTVQLLWTSTSNGEPSTLNDEVAEAGEGDESHPGQSTPGRLDDNAACDMDPISIGLHRYRCGDGTSVQPKSIDLLAQAEPSKLGIVEFDGTSRLLIGSALKATSTDQPFTLTFWMKDANRTNLGGDASLKSNSARQHILCTGDSRQDGGEKDRHLFAVAIDKCSLVVQLYRQKSIDKSLQEQSVEAASEDLLPSEWTFTVDEVCSSSSWHHYAIVYSPPSSKSMMNKTKVEWTGHDEELTLFVDGQPVPNAPELVQVKESLPIPTKPKDSREDNGMTIGACLHRSGNTFDGYFVGKLAGLRFQASHPRQYHHNDDHLLHYIQCLANCQPRLHVANAPLTITHLPELPDLEVSRLTALNIRNPSVEAMQQIARNLVYFNPRSAYSPQRRPEVLGIRLMTSLTFENHCRQVEIPDHTTYITLSDNRSFNDSVLEKLLELNDSAQPIRSPNQSADSRSVDSRPVDQISLTNQQERDEVQQISTFLLRQGIWIWPQLKLHWNSPGLAESEYPVISYCEIQLCATHSSQAFKGGERDRDLQQFAPDELLHVPPVYMSPALVSVNKSGSLRLNGPASIDDFNMALGHVRWVESQPEMIKHRCFTVECSHHQLQDGGGGRFTRSTNSEERRRQDRQSGVGSKSDVKTNTIVKEFVIRHPFHLNQHSSSDRVAKNPKAFSSPTLSAVRKKQLKIDNDGTTRSTKVEQSSMESPSSAPSINSASFVEQSEAELKLVKPQSSNKKSGTISVPTLLIGLVMLGAGAVVLIAFYLVRRSSSRISKGRMIRSSSSSLGRQLRRQGRPSAFTRSPSIRRRRRRRDRLEAGTPGELVKKPSDTVFDPLRVTINPSMYGQEFDMLQTKMCQYDRAVYDDFPEAQEPEPLMMLDQRAAGVCAPPHPVFGSRPYQSDEDERLVAVEFDTASAGWQSGAIQA